MAAIGELDSFARVACALEDWLDHVVIIGGWAHRLYWLHPHAQVLDHEPPMTLDADVALPARLPARKQDIRASLLAHGFMGEFLGDERPPATHYRLGGEPGGFYVEFLTPLAGAGHDRRGRRKATVEIAGVTSQQLRYLDILLEHPWQVDVETNGFSGRVQVANPTSFLVQKALIHHRRDRDDRAKDILYLYDTLEPFGSRLGKLREEWVRRVAPQLHPRRAATMRKAARTLFGEITDDIRRAALIPAGRKLSPASVRQACALGFEQVFT